MSLATPVEYARNEAGTGQNWMPVCEGEAVYIPLSVSFDRMRIQEWKRNVASIACDSDYLSGGKSFLWST